MVDRVLRIACTVVPTVLDRDQPLRLLQWENIDAHLQVYEPLLTYLGAAPEHAASPQSFALQGLAVDRWDRSDDATVYRFHLRRGVFSAYDHELTAEDVCWTWKRSLALGTVGAWIGANAGLQEAGQVRAIDRYLVEFRLPRPTTILPHLLSVIVPSLFDSLEVQRHATAADPWALNWLRLGGAGYGPYVPDVGRTAETFRLVRNRRYWKGPLGFDAIEFVAFPDPAERLAALRRGDAEAAIDLEVPAGRRDGMVIHHVPTTFRSMLGMNVTRPPFDRLDVRHAVAQALPYERIVAEAFNGAARRMRSCISDVVIGHTSAHHRWEYRPDEARRLLRPHLPLPRVNLAYHNELAAFPKMAEIVGAALAEVGLETEPIVLDAAEHGRKKLDRSLDLFLDSDGPITVDGRYALGHDVNPPLGGVFDFTGYQNVRIGQLLDAALAELDQQRMTSLLGDVQRIVLNDVPWIPLAQQSFVFGLRDSIVGYRWFPLARLRCRDLRPS